MSRLDPDVFEKAADIINEKGWWNGKEEGEQRCIFLALSDASVNVDNCWGYTDKLREHFGVQHNGELFALNDSQPDEEGKAWAIHHLIMIAEELRREVEVR